MKLRGLLFIAAVALLFSARSISQTPSSLTIDALKKYLLEKDHPEVFQDTFYHLRIENILEADIDNDGRNELVVQFFPHYRQSAPIIIYKVSSQSEISRVTEGLAPGPLQKVSGHYLDSHELGEGVDFAVGGEPGKPVNREDVLKPALTHFGGAVAYRSFYHADGRKGPAYYVDMTSVDLPENTKDCSAFEFSRLRQIAAGHVREDSTKNYLAAWVGGEIYVYLIKGISDRGMLDKKIWIVKAPAGFQGFAPGEGLKFQAASGTALLTLAN